MIANLKKLREKKGLSQQALADIFEISQQSVNKYENHETEPDIRMLTQLADFFETSVDYLVGNTDIQHKIEPVHPYELNAEEAELLEKYRMLRPEERERIRMVIDNYIK